jgi:hypothetical protein
MEFAAGTAILQRYTVEEPLGRGGMGAVYAVRRLSDGQRFALKVLPRVDAQLRMRLLREGLLQGSLDHPGVVRVIEVVEVDEYPAIVLELVEGGRTLQDRLSEGPVPEAAIDAFAHALFDAVEAAHRHGLVHRDLKPANILLQRVEGRDVPRIADFGLAKALDGSGASLATVTGALLGTPAYMAPEQVRDARGVNARADLFALGAVLYELVAGARAFGGSPQEAMFQAMAGSFAPLPDTTPAAWASAIAWALRPARDDRPADVAALRAAWTGELAAPIVAPSAETWGMASLGDATCPDFEALLEHRARPDIRDHLAGCAQCRTDLKLYAGFTEPAGRPWRRWALGFGLGTVTGLAAMTGVLGSLGDLLSLGPWLFLLLLLAGPSGALLSDALLRARDGRATPLLAWFGGPVLGVAVGAVATALGARTATRVIASGVDDAPALAARAVEVALGASTAATAMAFVGTGAVLLGLVMVARDRAADAGFDAGPVTVGVAGAAGLWLGEGTPAGLLAFAVTAAVSAGLSLQPRAEGWTPGERLVATTGAVALIAGTHLAARVEGLRRAVADTPDAWAALVDGWSVGWLVLAALVGAMVWRGADRDVRDAATGRVVVELAVLTALVGVPLGAALGVLRTLGRVLAGG